MSGTNRPAAEEVTGKNFGLMSVLVTLYAVAYLDRSILSLVAPALRADLGLSATQLGLLQGLGFVIFYSVLGLPLGALVDQMSRRVIIFSGVMCWSIAASLGGLTSNFWQLLFTRFGVGAGEAALSPAAYSMIADSVPPSRLPMMSTIFGSGSGIGSAISTAAGGALMSWAVVNGGMTVPLVGHLSPWQVVLFATGLPGLFLAPLIFLVREPVRRDQLKQADIGTKQLLRFLNERKGFLVPCFLGFALWQALIYSSTLWVVTRAVDDFGWSYASAGLTLALTAVSSPIGGVILGKITNNLVARGHVAAPLTVSWICTLVTGGGLVLSFTAKLPELFVIFLLVAYAPTIILALGVTALQMVSPNQYRGRLIALFTLATTLAGAGLGPLMPAVLADHVFMDDSMISESVAIVAAVTAPLAALLMYAACGPMRRAYAAAAEWRTPPDPAEDAILARD